MKDKYYSKISLYIDNQCNASETAEIRKHLKTCEECKKKYHEFLALKQDAKRLMSYAVSPFFARKVVAMAKHRRRETFWNALLIIPRPLLNAAFILSIVIITIIAMPWLGSTTGNDSGANVVENSLVSENVWPDNALETNDEALQFALNESEEARGETK